METLSKAGVQQRMSQHTDQILAWRKHLKDR
jgi:hypothetical protein